jgi:hypothetical protein
MPTELKLPKPEEALALVSDRPLGDASVDVRVLDTSLGSSQSFGGPTLAVNVRGDLKVRAFNSSDDEDEDGVLGAPDARIPAGALPPQLPLGDETAYLKFQAEAGIKAAVAGRTLDALGFQIAGAAELVLSDYHRHSRTEPTRAAVARDLKNLRTSLRLEDVLALEPGEAVAQQVAGRLSASVELSWADIFTGSIGPLSRLLGTGAPILVKLTAAATFNATVSFSDDFVLVFSRVDAGLWRIGLRKARTRQAALGLALGVEVQVPEPQQIEAILGPVVDGVIGEPLGKVERILKKATLDDLSDVERLAATFLIRRLGLDPAVATLEDLKGKVQAIKDGVAGAVEEVARAKVAMGFAYEYRRIFQETTVLQCTVTKAALERHHSDLVRGRLEGVITLASGARGGVALEQYLYQRTIKTEKSWGFSLSIGKWLQIGARDVKTVSRVSRRSIEGRRQDAYVGVRAYKETGQKKPKWSVDFSAEMPSFSRSPASPLVSEFTYGLHIAWHEDKGKLDPKTLSRWLDLAVLWGACSEEELPAKHEAVLSALKEPCSFVAQVTIPHPALTIMWPLIAAAAATDLGPFLGAAMPWMEKEPGRESVGLRRRLYGPLWNSYLTRPRRGRELALEAREHLAAQGFAGLANREAFFASTAGNDAFSFGGLVDLNPDTATDCQRFLNGAKRLNIGILSAAPNDGVIERVFEELEDFWTQSLHVRAVGAYLVDVARTGGVLGDVGRSFALTVGGGDGSETLVLASA